MEQLGRDTRQRPITKMAAAAAAAAAPLIEAKLYSCAFNYCCRVQFLLNCRLVSVCTVECVLMVIQGTAYLFVPFDDKLCLMRLIQPIFEMSEEKSIQSEWQT